MAAVAAPEMEDLRAPQMMCFQCEQTNAGKGCTTTGVCKKSPQTSGLQDLTILHALRLCQLAHVEGGAEAAVRDLVLEPLFATLTNVNFDDARFEQYLKDLAAHIAQLEARLKAGGQAVPAAPKALPAKLPETKQELLAAAEPAGLLARSAEVANEDLFGVIEMCAYGLKGTCAYFYHAEHLLAGDAAYSESERTEVYKEIFRLGNYLAEVNSTTAKENALGVALGECLAVGALNLKVMKMLDSAHTTLLGTPTPVEVTQEQPESPAILVSGHDLAVLHRLLPQAEKQKVNVYTHGEMLPAHSYPNLKKFENLKGHFGTHWGNQQKEFRHFPGVILMTSNCMMPPVGKYRDRIWTSGPVGFDKIPQVEDDFSALIQQALEFKDSVPVPRSGVIPHRKLQVGFGHAAVLGVADKVVEAIQSGALKHVFVIGGCDGTENSRSYFTDLAADTPQDSIILTLGCGKFRLNGRDYGTIGGIPRLLDVGQCNDAYGAVVIATKLAEALGCGVHDLPLHFAVSWFEQKAVAVLLTLLHLELKNIRLGPNLPAFITPKVLAVLNEKFGLKPANIHAEDEDLEAMLQGK
mmetsp:Transcript_74129/g.176751  ORF Transcript_74129/g.176751 Transcript_74129/m.176751 type:complete len:580 (+) Transcript_74129:87-1826(+)